MDAYIGCWLGSSLDCSWDDSISALIYIGLKDVVVVVWKEFRVLSLTFLCFFDHSTHEIDS
jgi:hypothetical protein